MKKNRLILFIFMILVSNIFGEIVTLIDGSKLNGQIMHYYQDKLEINVSGSSTVIDKIKLKSILFETPPANPEFSTPEKTFGIWEKAIKKGDWNKLVECYAMLYQNFIFQQFNVMPEADKEKMKNDFAESEMSILENKKNDNGKIILKINRKSSIKNETVELIFINENNEWKLIPTM